VKPIRQIHDEDNRRRDKLPFLSTFLFPFGLALNFSGAQAF
jgi:hypothetical protein